MQNRSIKLKILPTLIIIFCLVGFLYYINVDNTITSTDRTYIQKILSSNHVKPYKKGVNFKQQIRFIRAVQKSVLAISPHAQGIPYYHTREPKDLYTLRQGSCYDKSRTIEKILRINGFKTRHIAIYSTEKTHSKLRSLITPQTSSHAMSKVLTSKGWLLIGSRSPWISLNQYQQPITIQQIQKDVTQHQIPWDSQSYANMNAILKQHFIYVIGLYSRTGKFYPPYLSPFPNINWYEFLYNFTI